MARTARKIIFLIPGVLLVQTFTGFSSGANSGMNSGTISKPSQTIQLFPPPPQPIVPKAKPVWEISEKGSNCGYFARSVGDRPTLGKIENSVSYILVEKKSRRLVFLSGNKVMKEYKMSLGFNPKGHKQFEGDGRTPEGKYFIDYKNPNSAYHLSLKISYPNADDIRRAQSLNQKPGDEIMIHGWPNRQSQRDLVKKIHEFDQRRAYPDRWTAGCIAVQDNEIEEFFPKVEVGTPIEICR